MPMVMPKEKLEAPPKGGPKYYPGKGKRCATHPCPLIPRTTIPLTTWFVRLAAVRKGSHP